MNWTRWMLRLCSGVDGLGQGLPRVPSRGPPSRSRGSTAPGAGADGLESARRRRVIVPVYSRGRPRRAGLDRSPPSRPRGRTPSAPGVTLTHSDAVDGPRAAADGLEVPDLTDPLSRPTARTRPAYLWCHPDTPAAAPSWRPSASSTNGYSAKLLRHRSWPLGNVERVGADRRGRRDHRVACVPPRTLLQP